MTTRAIARGSPPPARREGRHHDNEQILEKPGMMGLDRAGPFIHSSAALAFARPRPPLRYPMCVAAAARATDAGSRCQQLHRSRSFVEFCKCRSPISYIGAMTRSSAAAITTGQRHSFHGRGSEHKPTRQTRSGTHRFEGGEIRILVVLAERRWRSHVHTPGTVEVKRAVDSVDSPFDRMRQFVECLKVLHL
ncbi:hypothetical protein DFP91_3934 [Pseudorhodoplanes sinuspersici]|nr:hypothetical protein DFP91_3934 [Pseudorhodoplanes sinuspersici]